MQKNIGSHIELLCLPHFVTCLFYAVTVTCFDYETFQLHIEIKNYSSLFKTTKIGFDTFDRDDSTVEIIRQNIIEKVKVPRFTVEIYKNVVNTLRILKLVPRFNTKINNFSND